MEAVAHWYCGTTVYSQINFEFHPGREFRESSSPGKETEEQIAI
jgi:hypothetical protein